MSKAHADERQGGLPKAVPIIGGLLSSIVVLVLEFCTFNAIYTLRHPVIKDITAGRGVIAWLRTAFKASVVKALLMIAVALLLGFVIYKILNRKPNRDSRGILMAKESTQGNNHEMTPAEKEIAFEMEDYYEPSGVILGKDKNTQKLLTVPYTGDKAPASGNVLVVGNTGSRKTSGVLLPNIFSCIQAGHSIVITDPKGEIYKETIAAAVYYGYNIRVFDIKAGEFDRSDGWDVLKYIRNSEDPQVAAEQVAQIIMSNIGTKEDNFWSVANGNLLKLCLMTVAIAKNYKCSGTHGRTLSEVFSLFMKTTDSITNLFTKDLLTDEYNRRYLSAPYETWAGNKEASQIKSGLASALNTLQSEKLTRILSEDEINFEELNQKKTIIYVICADNDRTYQCILALFTALLFRETTDIADRNGGSLRIPLYMFFEEFKNVGYIPDLAVKIATLRSRRINMIFCYQNISQLMDVYSLARDGEHEWETIAGSCALKLCCGTSDMRTAEYFSAQSGMMTIIEGSETKRVKSFMPSALKINPEEQYRTAPRGRAVYLPSEIMDIKLNEIFIKRDTHNPTIEEKYFYKDHPFRDFIVIDDRGIEITPTHLKRVPLWRRKEINEGMKEIDGRERDCSPDQIKVSYDRDRHKRRLQEVAHRGGIKSKLERFLYESDVKDEPVKQYYQKTNDRTFGDYLIKDSPQEDVISNTQQKEEQKKEEPAVRPEEKPKPFTTEESSEAYINIYGDDWC